MYDKLIKLTRIKKFPRIIYDTFFLSKFNKATNMHNKRTT